MASNDRAAARRSSALSLEKTSSIGWVEVGAIGRQVKQAHSGIFEALTDTGDFMRREVVGHDDATWSHFGDQAFFEPLLEDFAGHRAQDQLRSQYAVVLKTGDERRGHPVAQGDFGAGLWRATSCPSGPSHAS